jgi:hypothetical protein
VDVAAAVDGARAPSRSRDQSLAVAFTEAGPVFSQSSVVACISPRPVQNHTVGLPAEDQSISDVVRRLRRAALRDMPPILGWFGYVAAS